MEYSDRRDIYIKRKSFLEACLALKELNVVRVCEEWLIIHTDHFDRRNLTVSGVHYREEPPPEEPLCR